ncbi:uncharacterized protein LOC117193705 [Drosophila miranda]|uniref:uncharacterized protein LOC117193705 n=1 Tax=Drosophila miranda TaxID=7229 RepID=UPI00143F7537|nr:uncharacterized protein LOC117193705 [Drosophila miranda]
MKTWTLVWKLTAFGCWHNIHNNGYTLFSSALCWPAEYLLALCRFPCVSICNLQIPPVLVNCYYLLVAIIYGIELETFITYGVPQVLVIYIDLVAYSYLEEKRIIAQNRKYEADEDPVA